MDIVSHKNFISKLIYKKISSSIVHGINVVMRDITRGLNEIISIFFVRKTSMRGALDGGIRCIFVGSPNCTTILFV